MKVVLYGGTGMVGQGVLRECLLDPEVEQVLAIGRSAISAKDQKLRSIVLSDMLDYSTLEHDLEGYDACFFCLGVSSVGMKEADYRRVTYDYALAAARTLVARNPGMTFVYVSGAGTDSTEKGSSMWARVKGEAENAIQKLPFKASYMFRPGFIQPKHGIKSKTRLYGAVYALSAPLVPLFKRMSPNFVTTTELVGRAMLEVAKRGAPVRVLENADINALAARPGA